MPSSTTNGLGNGTDPDSHVRFIPLSYDPNDTDGSARQLVLALRPDWSSGDANLRFIRFTDGITNTLLKAVNQAPGLSKEEVDKDALLLRAYGAGTDILIDRHRETQNHELLMHFGLAPELLARFQNGMMYRFICGKTTSPEDLRTPPIYSAVARRLGQWHARLPCIHEAQLAKNGTNGSANGHSHDLNPDDLPPAAAVALEIAPGKPTPNLWTVMQKWILALPTATEAELKRQATLQEELIRLIARLSQRPGLGENGLVFAHCDLLSGNVIVEPKSARASANGNGNSHRVSVNFIDYEYAVPSPAAFDIANHFAEWGGFDCDMGALPTRAQRAEFVREYIHSYCTMLAEDSSSAPLDEEVEAEKLMAEIDAYRGVPGFYWGIWSLIQATISQIDFDYADYAEVRLAEYWAWLGEADGTREKLGQEMPLREKRWAQEE